MSEIFRDPEDKGRRRRVPRFVSNLGWMVGGIVLAMVLVADPLQIHPFDTWLHGVLGDRSESKEGARKSGEQKQLWTCGMHPEVIMEEPGTCPICGMNLVPVGGSETVADRGGSAERELLFYRNPMNPTITSPVPMKDEMGMDYVPIYADQMEGAASSGATVTIDPAIVQNMNVQTALVERGDLNREIRTVGYLEYDQQKMISVTTKYPGWIEKVYVNYIGEPVRRGQALFEIYAPELVQTQQELLSALEFARRMEGASDDARRRANGLVSAVRTRLSYWDISGEQIEQLEKRGSVIRTLTVKSPSSGVVMQRMAGLEGMAVKPGMELFHIANLSTLWLSVEVFEDQLPWLSVGSTATVTLNYFPGETFTGVVRYVDPQVSEETRTVGLNLEVPNRDGRLRSGMYATAVFAPIAGKNVVVIPSLAVLRTGQRNMVVVAEGEGRFTPREVQLGVEGDESVEVISGLVAGETIVTSAQFLLDSESNLREAIQKLIAARSGGGESPTREPVSQMPEDDHSDEGGGHAQ